MKTLNTKLALLFFLTLFGSNSFAQSTEIDKELGAQNAEMVKIQMGIYDNQEMTSYIRKVGERLVSHVKDKKFDYTFQIVDDPMPNAFALPGGYVYVTRGILTIIESEDELACVMAHEIIHVERRHSIKQLGNSILPKLLEVPGNIIGNVINEDLGNLYNAPIKTSNDLVLASYSRRFETESDEMGITLASKAGYDPLSMNDILTRLNSSVEYLTQHKTKKSYFDDHPFTTDRVKSINSISKDLKWSKQEPLDPNFPDPIDGLLFGENPNKGVFIKNTFLHPDLKFSITLPENWTASNQPEAVSAVFEDRNAGIFLGLSDNTKTPEQMGKAYVARLQKEFKKKPVKAESYTLNGNPGYLVTLIDDSGSEDMYLYMFWVKIDSKLFQLIGIGPKYLETTLQKSAASLHTLSMEESKKISKTVLKVVSANDETLEDLLVRNSCKVPPEAIALINGIEIGKRLTAAEKIKILIEVPYQ